MGCETRRKLIGLYMLAASPDEAKSDSTDWTTRPNEDQLDRGEIRGPTELEYHVVGFQLDGAGAIL